MLRLNPSAAVATILYLWLCETQKFLVMLYHQLKAGFEILINWYTIKE